MNRTEHLILCHSGYRPLIRSHATSCLEAVRTMEHERKLSMRLRLYDRYDNALS
jgi:hypothetical protein